MNQIVFSLEGVVGVFNAAFFFLFQLFKGGILNFKQIPWFIVVFFLDQASDVKLNILRRLLYYIKRLIDLLIFVFFLVNISISILFE